MKLSTDTVLESIEAHVSLEAEIIETIDLDSGSDSEQDEGPDDISDTDTTKESDTEDQGPGHEADIQYIINAESENNQYDIDTDSEAIQHLDSDPDIDSSNVQNDSADCPTLQIDSCTQFNANRKERLAWVSKSGERLSMIKYHVAAANIPALQDSSSTTLDGFIQVKNDTVLVDDLTTSFRTITTEPKACCTPTQKLAANYDISCFLKNVEMYAHAGLAARLTGSNPPPLDYFRQLPSVFGLSPDLLRNHYLVYVLILDKPNEMSSMCIGSTFKTSNGACFRVREYTTSQCR